MFFKTLFFLFKNFDMWSSAILDSLIVKNTHFPQFTNKNWKLACIPHIKFSTYGVHFEFCDGHIRDRDIWGRQCTSYKLVLMNNNQQCVDKRSQKENNSTLYRFCGYHQFQLNYYWTLSTWTVHWCAPDSTLTLLSTCLLNPLHLSCRLGRPPVLRHLIGVDASVKHCYCLSPLLLVSLH